MLTDVNPDQHRPALAHCLVNLQARLSDADRPAGALTAQREAVGLYRELAALNPNRYRSELVRALTDLEILLTNVGETSEAAEVHTEISDATDG